MGNTCEKYHHHGPDYSQQCTPGSFVDPETFPMGAADKEYILPGFCTYEGKAGVSFKETHCKLIGDGTTNSQEWKWSGKDSDQCSYFDCMAHVDSGGPGCCDGCCGVVGIGARCERVAYLADPISCAVSDMKGKGFSADGNPSLCFQHEDKAKTCDPAYRDITSTSSQDIMLDYCLGNQLSFNSGGITIEPVNTGDYDEITAETLDKLFARWIDLTIGGPDETSSKLNTCDGSAGKLSPCFYVIGRNLFGNNYELVGEYLMRGQTPPPELITLKNVSWLKDLVKGLVDKYTSLGFKLGANRGDSGYHDFQDVIFNIFKSMPALAERTLRNLCSNVTTTEVILNPNLVQWCGCYMGDGEYAKYDELDLPRECTPTCAIPGNIGLAGEGGYPQACTTSACIIDDVTINLYNSNILGDLSLQQICGGCSTPGPNHNNSAGSSTKTAGGTSSCSCIISDITEDIINTTFTNQIFNQVCQNNNKCYQSVNQGGIIKPKEVPCSSHSTQSDAQKRSDQEAQKLRESNFFTNLSYVGIVFALIAGLFIIYYLLQ